MTHPPLEVPTPPTAPAWELKLSRVFQAPRALVFECWAKPEFMRRWFGPRGFGMPTCDMDFREGGRFAMDMSFPDGTPNTFHGTFREIVQDERIVWSSTFPTLPEDIAWTTVTFTDHPQGTEVHVHQCFSIMNAMLEGASQGAPQGWDETIDRLVELLRVRRGQVDEGTPHVAPGEKRVAPVSILSDTEIVITRWFAAPRPLVWRALTDPELHGQWYGGGRYKQVACTIDPQTGGSFAWTLEAPDGQQFHFKGDYRDVRPPAWCVATESFLMGDTWTTPYVSAMALEERDGFTFLSNHIVYASQADRDGHLGAGMEAGMNQAMQALDAVLDTLA